MEQAEVCARVPGLTQQALSNLEKRDSRTSEFAVQIADALGVSPRWLLTGEEGVDEGDTLEPAGRPRSVRPIPVRGTAKLGSDGYYECLDGPEGVIDYYGADPDAFAVRVKGDSMHPAIRHNSFVVVEPGGQCVVGEYVALQLRDGRKMVKELVRETPDEVTIESVNGNHRQTIERKDIDRMHPVAAVVAPSRWRPA